MYLMMMYVSLEQEEAVKHFFSTKGWSFQKPDLSVLTDRTGPLVIPVSQPLAAAVETRTPEQTEAGRKPVLATHPRTSAKPKISPKQQPKKGKATASKRSADTENREFEEILKEAELIAASVSELGETGDNKGTQTSVKQEQIRDSFNVEQTDNHDDTYDDYNDFNEEDKGETEVPPIEFVNDEVMQGPSDETLTRKKRKLGDRSELSELDDIEDSQEASIKDEIDAGKMRKTPGTGKCTICGKVLHSSLNRHMQMHASGGHQCSFCNKMYIGKDKLDQHVRTKHMGESAGQCEVCNKTFKSIDGYRSHMKTHQDNLKSVCSICDQRFVNDSTLRKHLRIHSTKKSFFCNDCGKSFKYKYSLKRHSCKLFNESPLHVCGICKLIFRTSAALIEHHRLHHNGLDYVCNNCGKSFHWHQSLTRHERKCLGLERNDGADQLAGWNVDNSFEMNETGLDLSQRNVDVKFEMNELAQRNVDNRFGVNETGLELAQRNEDNSFGVNETGLELAHRNEDNSFEMNVTGLDLSWRNIDNKFGVNETGHEPAQRNIDSGFKINVTGQELAQRNVESGETGHELAQRNVDNDFGINKDGNQIAGGSAGSSFGYGIKIDEIKREYSEQP